MSEKTTRPQTQTQPKIDPSDIAHHLRVAADKYHELARTLLEEMNEAIGALPAEQKAAYRATRESLAKLFDDQASDALRLAEIFDLAREIEFVLSRSMRRDDACTLAEAAPDSAISGGNLIRDRLVAGKVDRPAIPGGRDTPASDHELTTAIAAAGRTCCVCLEPIPDGHGVPCPPGSDLDGCWWCDRHGGGVPRIDHAACDNPPEENRGSLQHTPTTPTTWIGNEQLNRQVGGAP